MASTRWLPWRRSLCLSPRGPWSLWRNGRQSPTSRCHHRPRLQKPLDHPHPRGPWSLWRNGRHPRGPWSLRCSGRHRRHRDGCLGRTCRHRPLCSPWRPWRPRRRPWRPWRPSKPPCGRACPSTRSSWTRARGQSWRGCCSLIARSLARSRLISVSLPHVVFWYVFSNTTHVDAKGRTTQTCTWDQRASRHMHMHTYTCPQHTHVGNARSARTRAQACTETRTHAHLDICRHMDMSMRG